MTTTHHDPHTCAHGIELRTSEEIEAERQHYRMRCEALWPGWMLVPIVPTQTMCQEGQWKAKEWPSFPLRISPIYQAMIAAVVADFATTATTTASPA